MRRDNRPPSPMLLYVPAGIGWLIVAAGVVLVLLGAEGAINMVIGSAIPSVLASVAAALIHREIRRENTEEGAS